MLVHLGKRRGLFKKQHKHSIKNRRWNLNNLENKKHVIVKFSERSDP